MADPCTVCCNPANENYTLHTFDLYICIPDSGVCGAGGWYLVGDVQTGSFAPEQEILDHYNGKSGALDARVKVRGHWNITAECDEITAQNLSILLGAPMINVSGGCRIPLYGGGILQGYGVRLVHTFPNGTKTLTIRFWASNIVGDWTLDFSAEWASYTMTISSIECPDKPDYPYGYVEFNEACPPS